MKAVILVGGEGTRLRPLTTTTPKPLIPLVNRPFLDHILFLLRTHGIHDVILAMAYRAESFEDAYGDGSHLGMKLTYVREVEPLGTGGAIKNVESYLDPGETFIAFNGDVLTDIDLTAMLSLHRQNGSVCTISLTPVDDPSQYGVVDLDEMSRIQRFTEKPKREEATSNWINAGTYIMESSILAHIPVGEFHMVERGLFPNLLSMDQPMYGYRTDAYWIDIGTPTKYLQAQEDLLLGKLKSALPAGGEEVQPRVWVGEGSFINSSARLTGPIVLGKGCKVRAGVQLTGPLVLGDGCDVDDGVHLQGVVAWRDVQFGSGSRCIDSIFGNSSKVGAACEIGGISVIGDHATVGANRKLTGEKLDVGADLDPDDGSC